MSDAILQITERLPQTDSLEDLRIADILNQAGAFYGRYANTADVVAALVRRGIDEAIPVAEAALQSERMADRDQLLLMIEGWLQILSRHRAPILAARVGMSCSSGCGG